MKTKKIYLNSGWSLRQFDVVSSSNDIAIFVLKNLKSLSEGMGFLVNSQTKGRGRLGRKWISSAGEGVYMSIILCPNRNKSEWPSLSFLVANSVYDTLINFFSELSGKLKLKWPNDLLIKKFKIGGILIESCNDGIVIGIGINIKNSPIIDNISWTPGNLSMFCEVKKISRYELCIDIMNSISKKYNQWKRSGGKQQITYWKEKCDMVGKHILVKTFFNSFEGICHEFLDNGHLVLIDNLGRKKIMTSGDVEIIREYNVTCN